MRDQAGQSCWVITIRTRPGIQSRLQPIANMPAQMAGAGPSSLAGRFVFTGMAKPGSKRFPRESLMVKERILLIRNDGNR